MVLLEGTILHTHIPQLLKVLLKQVVMLLEKVEMLLMLGLLVAEVAEATMEDQQEAENLLQVDLVLVVLRI